jgi:ligand-binding sensor domain-containing protein
MFFTSCNGQTSTNLTTNNTNSTTKKEQNPKIVRTLGTQCENVGCQLLDKDGNLWFSISGEGAYCYDGKSFINFTAKDGLCNNNVCSIIEDRAGNILLGTSSGICKYDGIKFTKYPVPDTLSITCMLEDKDGNLWFGAMGNGIYRYNGKTLDNFLNSNKEEYNLGSNNQLILDILQDKNGILWFSSWNGGGVWRYDGKIFTNFLPPKDYYLSNEDGRTITNSVKGTFGNFPAKNIYSESLGSITDDMIFSISEDKAGNLWFATRRHGACRYDGKSFSSFSENEGFVNYGVYSILEDKKGNMWFSTEKNGVYCYDGKTFTNYATANGLVNNSVFSILEDKDGNLWFGTRWFGLSRFDGKSFTTFSQYDN